MTKNNIIERRKYFPLKRRMHIFLKFKVGHLFDCITSITNVPSQLLPITFRTEFKPSVAPYVALASHPVIPAIPALPARNHVLSPAGSTSTWESGRLDISAPTIFRNQNGNQGTYLLSDGACSLCLAFLSGAILTRRSVSSISHNTLRMSSFSPICPGARMLCT